MLGMVHQHFDPWQGLGSHCVSAAQHLAKGQPANITLLIINLSAQQVVKQAKLHQKAVAALETVSKAAAAQSTEVSKLQKSEKDIVKQTKAIERKVGCARELMGRKGSPILPCKKA